MTQFARPDADVATNGWATSPLWDNMQLFPWNQSEASGFFIDSPNNPTGQDSETVKFGLNTLSDPGTNKGHRLRVAWYKQGTSTMRGDVELRTTGGTLLATLTNTDVTPVAQKIDLDTYLLSESEANAITDYSALDIWIRPNRTAGSTTTDLRVKGVELEVPSAALLDFPSGVPTDAFAWYSADSLGLADDATVTSWEDSSGNGRSMQSRATGRPTYKLSINEFYGQPAVRFDGTDDALAAPWGSTVSEPFCYVFVMVPRSFTDSGATETPVYASCPSDYAVAINVSDYVHKCAFLNDAVAQAPCSTQSLPDWMMEQAGASQHVCGGVPALGTRFVLVHRWIVGDDEIWENGVNVVTCDAGSNPSYGLQLGAREDLTRHAQVDIRHVLVYDRNLTNQEILNITAAFEAEGLPTPVPHVGPDRRPGN